MADEPDDDEVIGKSKCTETSTEEPPVWISDVHNQWANPQKTNEKIYENFRNKDDYKKVDQYIPKGTIVYVPQKKDDYEDNPNNDPKKEEYVKVDVLKVPDIAIEKTLGESWFYHPKYSKNPNWKEGDPVKDKWKGKWLHKSEFRSKVKGTAGKKRVVAGSKGYIHYHSLKKVSDYVFTVKEDSLLEEKPGDDFAGKKIKFKLRDNGLFATRTCCFTLAADEEYQSCSEYYFFEIFDENNNLIETKIITEDLHDEDNIMCSIYNQLIPIAKEDDDEITKIYNLLDDYAGVDTELKIFRKELEIIPKMRDEGADKSLIKIPIDENNNGPYGSLHYTPDDKKNSDSFMTPFAACAFMQVLKKQQEMCSDPGCKVMFGDMYHKKEWHTHASHHSGTCVDVRPFRLEDDDLSKGGLSYSATYRYDRDKTQKFIEMLMDAGAGPIYFNDNTLRKKYSQKVNGKWVPAQTERMKEMYPDTNGKKPSDVSVPTYSSGHNSHIHFCFEPDNPRAQKTCKDGL